MKTRHETFLAGEASGFAFCKSLVLDRFTETLNYDGLVPDTRVELELLFKEIADHVNMSTDLTRREDDNDDAQEHNYRTD